MKRTLCALEVRKQKTKTGRQIPVFVMLPWKDSELYTAVNEFEYDYQ